jgi:hypothetical protein
MTRNKSGIYRVGLDNHKLNTPGRESFSGELVAEVDGNVVGQIAFFAGHNRCAAGRWRGRSGFPWTGRGCPFPL